MFNMFSMGGMTPNFTKGPTVTTRLALSLEQLETGGNFKVKYLNKQK